MFVPGGLEVNINGFEDGDQVGVDVTRLQDQEQHQEEQDQD